MSNRVMLSFEEREGEGRECRVVCAAITTTKMKKHSANFDVFRSYDFAHVCICTWHPAPCRVSIRFKI